MAKVSLTKLNIVKTINPIEIEINGEKIQVIQYLPLEQKAALLENIINDVLGIAGNNSPIREELYSIIYIIKYYTNINITETMINNASKTYDILYLNGIINLVKDNIPDTEYYQITQLIHKTIQTLAEYRLSAAGILDTMRNEQTGDLKDIGEITEQLEALQDNSLLKDVLEKLV